VWREISRMVRILPLALFAMFPRFTCAGLGFVGREWGPRKRALQWNATSTKWEVA